jgi:hypothetical protein
MTYTIWMCPGVLLGLRAACVSVSAMTINLVTLLGTCTEHRKGRDTSCFTYKKVCLHV